MVLTRWLGQLHLAQVPSERSRCIFGESYGENAPPCTVKCRANQKQKKTKQHVWNPEEETRVCLCKPHSDSELTRLLASLCCVTACVCPCCLAAVLFPRLVSRETSSTARRTLPPSRDGRVLGNKVGEVHVFVCHVGFPGPRELGQSRTATPKVIVGAVFLVREAFSS